jgi:hypothetical protein
MEAPSFRPRDTAIRPFPRTKEKFDAIGTVRFPWKCHVCGTEAVIAIDPSIIDAYKSGSLLGGGIASTACATPYCKGSFNLLAMLKESANGPN